MRLFLIFMSIAVLLSGCKTTSTLDSQVKHIKGSTGYVLMSMALGVRPVAPFSMLYKKEGAVLFDNEKLVFEDSKFKLFKIEPGDYYFYQMILPSADQTKNLGRVHLNRAHFNVTKDTITVLGYIIPEKYEQQIISPKLVQNWLKNNYPNIANEVVTNSQELKLIPQIK